MTNDNFKMTRVLQDAKDFNIEYFENGYSKQVIYTLFLNDKPIKTCVSTKRDQNLFALVSIGNKAVNGIEVIPAEEIIYAIQFSSNPNKKTKCGQPLPLHSDPKHYRIINGIVGPFPVRHYTNFPNWCGFDAYLKLEDYENE